MAEITGPDRREFEQAIPGDRYLLISHTPIPGGGLMITYSDVTELRATERKLRDNEQRYGLVAEAVTEGIYDWNIEKNRLFVSARLKEIFGFTAFGLTSQSWFAPVHAEDVRHTGTRSATASAALLLALTANIASWSQAGNTGGSRITGFQYGTARDGQSDLSVQ